MIYRSKTENDASMLSNVGKVDEDINVNPNKIRCRTNSYDINSDNDKYSKQYYLKLFKNGDNSAAYYLGVIEFGSAINNYDYKRAYAYFIIASENNVSDAQYYVALCNYYGLGTEQNDCNAFTNAYSAVLHNSPIAYSILGLCYYYGRGTSVNYKKAYKAFNKLNNDPICVNNSAVCLLLGKGVAININKGIELLRSCEYHPVCAYNLAQCHAAGYGVAKNAATAEKLYIKAHAQGFRPAMRKVYEIMSDGGVTIKKNNVKAQILLEKQRPYYDYYRYILIEDSVIANLASYCVYTHNNDNLNIESIAKKKEPTRISGDYTIIKRKPRSDANRPRKPKS